MRRLTRYAILGLGVGACLLIAGVYLFIYETVSANPRVVGHVEDSEKLARADGLDIKDGYAFIVGGNHFTVVDISNPAAPFIARSMTDDQGRLDKAYGIDISGNYAYLAVGYSGESDRLTVVDISHPTQPRIVSSLADHANLDGALHIAVSGGYAYVSTPNSNGVSVVDVSNPAKPAVVGSVHDDIRLYAADGIWVQGRYVFVVSHHMSGPGVDYFSAIDVSDPKNPVLLDSIGESYFRGGDQMYIIGNYAYVPGNSNNEPSSGHSLSIVDVSNPNGLKVVGHVTDSELIGSSCYVVAAGKLAYLTSWDSKRLTVVDVSDPTSPRIIDSVRDEKYLSGPQYVQISGKYAYVTSSGVFTIINIDGIGGAPAAFLDRPLSTGNSA